MFSELFTRTCTSLLTLAYKLRLGF